MQNLFNILSPNSCYRNCFIVFLSDLMVVLDWLPLFSNLFLATGGGLPLCPKILHYTQWLCLSSEFSVVRDAGLEPGTTASVVWSSTNKPTHLFYYLNKLFHVWNDGTSLLFWYQMIRTISWWLPTTWSSTTRGSRPPRPSTRTSSPMQVRCPKGNKFSAIKHRFPLNFM